MDSAATSVCPISRAKTFFCLALLFIGIRLPWIFTVPMQEAPDEFAHYWVINFIHAHMRLPSAAEVFAGGPAAVYGSLPQLGYLPHLLFCAMASANDLALLERFGSLFAGLLMLYSAYKIGKLLFPENQITALALPLAVSLHPQIVFLHSYANNDSTSSALSSLIILLMLESIRYGNTSKRTLFIGALVGWLTLSKYAGLAIIPVVALSLVASCYLNGTGLLSQIPIFLLSAALASILPALWFWHNVHEFNGDFMGTKTMYKTWAVTFHRDLNYYLSPSRIIKDLRWWRMTFFSYWALFGYMSKYLWRPVYIAYTGILIASIAGWICGAIVRFKQSPQDKKDVCMWLSLTFIVLLNIAAMIWASVYNLGGPQGRYLFTSEVPIMSLLIGGLSRFKGKAGNRAVVAFLVFNAGVCLYSWLLLFQSYGGFRSNPL